MEKKDENKSWWTIRDWKWTVGILAGIIIYLLTYNFWGKSGDLTNVISIGSGLASIALAIAAIIYSMTEGIKSSVKEEKVDTALNSINTNLNSMEKLINKLDTDLTKTFDKVSVFTEMYQNHYSSNNYEIDRELDVNYETTPQESITNDLKVKQWEETVSSEEENVTIEKQESKVEDESPKTFSSSYPGLIRNGDIFFADLSTVVGSEQGGKRPVLVIQNDIANRFSPTVTIAAITAQINKAKLPTHVELNANNSNLKRDSIVLLDQLRTIDKTRLIEKIGSIDDSTLLKVKDALAFQTGI